MLQTAALCYTLFCRSAMPRAADSVFSEGGARVCSDNRIRLAKAGYAVISLALCAIGGVMAARPELSLALIGVIVGAVLGVFGVVKLIGYFSRDLYQLAFQYDLAFGILLLALSAIILLRLSQMLSFLCVALGVAILADGLLKIQTALDARRFGLEAWPFILALAIAAGVAGTVLMLRPWQSAAALIRLMGISLAAEGALSLCVALCAVKTVRYRQLDPDR